MKGNIFSKRIVSVMVAVIMVMAMVPSIGVFAREYAAEVSINGVTVDFKNEPYSKSDVIFVPLEEIGGYLNLNITKEGNVYTILRMGQTLKVESGNLVAFLDGKEVVLSTNPVEKNGITYVPAELFSKGFGCPVTVSEDKRSADIVPNVYRVSITEQAAAAVSAAVPDKDVLGTGASSVDTIFNNAAVFPQLEKSLFYMIDLSAFNGLKIKNAFLSINIDKSEYSPTLRIERTAPWKKGEVTYNTQPVSYEKEYVTGLVAESNYVDKQYDIVSLVNAAQQAGETLAIKLMGIPHSSKKNSKNNSFTIRGVNHAKAPYVEIYLDEVYNFPIKTAAQETEDYEEQRYSRIALLKSLGVFTENDEFPLDLEEGVQRQEFVKYALRLRNASVQEAGGEQFFSDVPADAPFYKDVMTAHAMGLVSGWQGIAFRPYDNITLGEAITILGRMLNYNIFADERGGFTPGYFAAARNGDLYNGAEIEKEALSFKKMFVLLEDALDAKMLNVRTYSSNGTAEYTFDASKTILTEYWNAALIEGVVEANEYASLAGGSGNENTIVIKGKPLTLKFKPYNEFLGYNVKAYYDRYEDKLLYMGIKEYDITKIDIADITSKNGTKTVDFTYKRENGSLGKESFTADEKKEQYVIYNGKRVKDDKVNYTLLNADAGSIKLVGDSLTVITAYKTVVVSTVNAVDETVYDTYDARGRSLKLNNKEYSFTDINAKEMLLEEIEKNDVVSVAESLDGEFLTAIVSKTKVTGAIEAAENSGSDDAVYTIAGNEYELCNTAMVAGKTEHWKNALEVGFNSTFFINHEGKIAGTSEKKSEGIVGYLLTMGYKGSALSKKLQAAVVVKDSEEYVVYDLADKVEVDCIKFKKHEDIESHFTHTVEVKDEAGTLIDSYQEIEKQPIIFDLNDDGKIKKINSPKIGNDGTKDVESEDENLILRHSSSSNDKMNYKSTGIYGGLFFLGQGDNIIVTKTGEELEDYATKNSLASNEFYYLDIWTIGKNSPEVVVALYNDAKEGGPSVGDDPYLYLVDRVVTAFDSDGMEVKKLYYYDGVDSRKSVIVDSKYESAVDGFARGDIIRFSTNIDGELQAARKYYDYDPENPTLTARAGGYNNLNRVSAGYVGRIEKSYVQLVDYNAEDVGNPSEGKLKKEIYGWKDADDHSKGYNSDYEYTWHDGKRFKNIYSYEVSSAGVTVKRETLDSIRTYEDVPYNPHGLILNAAYENIRPNIWLLEMKPPINTGEFEVKYDGGGYGGTKFADGKVKNIPTFSEYYNLNDVITIGTLLTGDNKNIPDPEYVKAEGEQNDYFFKGWKVNGKAKPDGSLYKKNDTVTVTGDTVLEAQWQIIEKIQYTFTDGNGNAFQKGWPLINPETGVGNYKTSLPGPTDDDVKTFTKDGHFFAGWKLLDANDDYNYNPISGKFVGDREFTPNDYPTGATFEIIWKDAYEIATVDDLKWFANKVNGANGVEKNASAKAKLVADIYLNDFYEADGTTFDEDWYETEANVTVATSWNSYMMKSFAGEFDGQNHTIYGLYMKGGSGTGFFSSVSGGTVKNVTFKGAYVVSTDTSSSSGKYTNGKSGKPIAVVAAIVVNSNDSATANTTVATFEQITVYGKITAGREEGKIYDILTVGTIVGNVRGGAKDKFGITNITDCTSYVDIIDTDNTAVTNATWSDTYVTKSGTGGIVGLMGEASGSDSLPAVVNMTRCYNYGDIIVPYQNERIGGLVGGARTSKLTFDSCGNAGDIRGKKVSNEMYGKKASTCTVSGANEATTPDNFSALGSLKVFDPNETIN